MGAPENIRAFLDTLTPRQAAGLLYDWPMWARPAQLPPKIPYSTWLVLAGRGFGKTRTGAEWVRNLVETRRAGRLAIVAPTAADLRDVCVEGESGILATAPPWNRPLYEPSKRRLTWNNGAIATLFSAEEPERLRGPQHDAAWCDEVASWPEAQGVIDMLDFGLRLGVDPPTLLTTTPRPVPYIKHLLERAKGSDDIVITRGTTYDNIANLAKSFRKKILQFEGTRLGDQEIHAKLVDFNEQGIVLLEWFRRYGVAPDRQHFKMLRLSFDTAYKAKALNDPSVCEVWAETETGHYLLDVWRDRVVYPDLRRIARSLCDKWQPDEVLIEDAASGQALIEDLRREANYSIIPINPRGEGDKAIRLAKGAPAIESGTVFLPMQAPWLYEFEQEISNFPLPGFNDDQVDSLSQYLNRVREPYDVFIG